MQEMRDTLIICRHPWVWRSVLTESKKRKLMPYSWSNRPRS